ncbi:MAG: hypothetical protein ACRD47_17370 [Nitrososphaeraceae archaeon]
MSSNVFIADDVITCAELVETTSKKFGMTFNHTEVESNNNTSP